MKILIVEDEEIDCRYHIGRAYQNGYQCECVYDGAEAAGLFGGEAV